ncbi:CaiB/BaiF CoA transferase family protein [Corynebacterium comes]|uniref:Succinyl-CoA:(R)-benzylsuccinate CoA-transferase subunit BbsF n=1 Tax=Corynebacterium comes TaxID=2675218 RepID=A0A6B8W4L8_9CORY|nr:CoA transferase [Corynebacterium comes]QGU05876.1 Succinyl-CoA:(R)-benzylsuccinate CoA-transferase subunit BbsF [Corynebacterium comes]
MNFNNQPNAQLNSLGQLAGVTVIEMGQNLAAPYASSILADLGAEVIKVEKPGGDDARTWGPPFINDLGVSFHLVNRNKKSVELALDQPEDYEAFLQLIRSADVFIHNLRPGVEYKLRVDSETLREVNPALIYSGMSAFGHVGPMKYRPGYEPLLQAFCGMVAINGDPSGPPSRVGPSVVDLGTGMWSVIGVLTALFTRQLTGQGATVNTSLLETAVNWSARHSADFGASGETPPRVGTGHNSLTPYGAYNASDGPIVITAGNDRLFTKLAHAIGRSEWLEDPRFATNNDRTTNRDVLNPLLSEVIATRNMQEWDDILQAAGVPCAPIHSIADVAENPQVRAMGMFLDSERSDMRMVRLPLSIDGEVCRTSEEAPALGAHQYIAEAALVTALHSEGVLS